VGFPVGATVLVWVSLDFNDLVAKKTSYRGLGQVRVLLLYVCWMEVYGSFSDFGLLLLENELGLDWVNCGLLLSVGLIWNCWAAEKFRIRAQILV